MGVCVRVLGFVSRVIGIAQVRALGFNWGFMLFGVFS